VSAVLVDCQSQAQRRGDRVIANALAVLRSRLRMPGTVLNNPYAVKHFLILKLAELQHESFLALWCDSQRRLIETDELFRGSIAQTAVYPREVVKRALQLNAASVIFAHNHPSGCAEPSLADEVLTGELMQALRVIGVELADHVVVGGCNAISMVERGLPIGCGVTRSASSRRRKR
jgi:DNA repair protein RadC